MSSLPLKAVILNGSHPGDDRSGAIQAVLTDALTGHGWAVEPFLLHELEIRHCLGCFGCWVQTPGLCLIDDAARDISRTVVQSDLAVFITPITFGGYSSELKKALDRMICIVSPSFMRVNGEVHHKPRYPRYPRLMAIGLLSRADPESEEIFRTLVRRNAINLHSPAHVVAVIPSNRGEDTVRREIQVLLHALEIRR